VGIHTTVPGFALQIWCQCQSKVSRTSKLHILEIYLGEFMSNQYFALNFWSLLELHPEVTAMCKRPGEWGKQSEIL
jgi:hypothetical protein